MLTNQIVLTAGATVNVLTSVAHIRETPGDRRINNSKLFARSRPQVGTSTWHESVKGPPTGRVGPNWPRVTSAVISRDALRLRRAAIVCVLIVHTRVDVFHAFLTRVDNRHSIES